ncbi:MAG: PstS family phosphate ABC transporter substrate-binding protein [Syntrophorhabdales bacterium]|jgi:phosphate transport system substrate-binding protein|nr:PstS family phosphate ABC transporter substrate-binding protein [Syntrophorhabdales bacterium]
MDGKHHESKVKKASGFSWRGLRTIVFILTAIIFFTGLTGCNSKDEKEKAPKVTIRVSGAWALYPMMVKWAEEYSKINPKIRLDISAGGAGKGVADTLSNLVDIGMVSRDLKPEEIKQGAVFIPVVKDAVFPTLNADNPELKRIMEKGIKRQTFIDLWIKGRQMSWGEITGSSKRDMVQVYTRSDSCGAAETWAQYLGGKSQEDLKGIAVYSDPGLADAVRKDINGIGYNNLNYAFDSKTGLPVKGLMVIPIDINEDGKIESKEEIDTRQKAMNAVASGVYPSPPARALHIVTKGHFKDEVKTFLEWALTDGQKFVDEAGYIKLSENQIKEAIDKIKR